MGALLEHRRDSEGAVFRLMSNDVAMEPETWVRAEDVRLETGSPGRTGPLLRLIEDEQAEARGDAIFVSHAAIAAMDDSERRGVGLPTSRSVLLELRASGAVSDADFTIERRLSHPDGRPIVAPSVKGCFLRIGNEEAVLAEPLYSLWHDVERLNALAEPTLEQKLTAIGEINAELPGGASLSDDLQSVRITLATTFALDPFRNERGEPDFEPRLGRWVHRQTAAGETERIFDSALPAARQEDFSRRFRQLSVKRRYAVGNGAYVVLAPGLEKAMRVVQSVQRADAGERRRFRLGTSPVGFDTSSLPRLGTSPVGFDTSSLLGRGITPLFFLRVAHAPPYALLTTVSIEQFRPAKPRATRRFNHERSSQDNRL